MKDTAGLRHTGASFQLFFLASLFLLSLFAETAAACAVTTPYNRTVDEGQNAYYYVRVLNNDHPAGVSIRVEIEQDISDFEVKNQEFSLNYMQYDYTYITVHTDDVKEKNIHTTVHVLEKGTEDSGFTQIQETTFNTTVRHAEKEDAESVIEDDSNLLIAGATLSVAVGLGYYAYSRGLFSFPFVSGYTKLDKDALLKNKTRKLIYTFILNNPQGITFSEIKEKTGIASVNLIYYHLKSLRRYNYIRCVDHIYYPAGTTIKPPLISQIRLALQSGAKNSNQVAVTLKSSRGKINYHMKKHGLVKDKKYKK